MPIRGVVFDLDGTLVSQELDFEAIRREIGLRTGTPLLEALRTLDAEARRRAETILDRHERAAAERASVFAGIPEFLSWLETRSIRRAVLTRNSRFAAETVLTRCGLRLDPVVAREDGPPKPDPAGVWRICAAWALPPRDVLTIGDYLFDIEAGRKAGTRTALVTHGRDWPFAHLADVTFPNFRELPDWQDGWFEE
jgi:HAD superfamily hydrolase (TIGR01549 family)